MKAQLLQRASALLILAISLFGAAALTASADHGEMEEESSHATTVHAHADEDEDHEHEHAEVTVTPTYTATIDASEIKRMQYLLTALQALVVLLEQKAELEEGNHTHDHE